MTSPQFLMTRLASATAIALLCLQAHADTSNATATAKPAAASQRLVILNGSVDSLNSQSLFIPVSDINPVTLKFFVPEGGKVKKGDVVLSIGTSGNNTQEMQTRQEQQQVKMALELAKLEVVAIEAERALHTAQIALAKARLDASLPQGQISALDYDKYQTDKEKALKELEIRKTAVEIAHKNIAKTKTDGELEARKNQLQMAYLLKENANTSVHAEVDGVVIHAFNQWRGERYDEGVPGFSGHRAGQVMTDGAFELIAWALEADRLSLKEGMPVYLTPDAYPGKTISSTIKRISPAPEAGPSGEKGRFFKVTIPLPPQAGLTYAPGMSIRVSTAPAPARHLSQSLPDNLTIDGEVLSRNYRAIIPPSIRYIWNYTVGQIVPEGTHLKAGEQVMQLQSTEVQERLVTSRNLLNEKNKALEKLLLEQKEAERLGEIQIAEARAAAEKAARKATMPKELIRRIDYDKLVIDKEAGQTQLELQQKLVAAQSAQRNAEKRFLQTEMQMEQKNLNELQAGIKALTITAPTAGIVQYRMSYDDEKIKKGSKVWMGQTIAGLADPDNMYIKAKVPEAQYGLISMGQTVTVKLPGGNQTAQAKILRPGLAFQSRSHTDNSIVRDLELEFTQRPANLKPGSAVQVIIPLTKAATSAQPKSTAK